MLQAEWIKSDANTWLDFRTFNLLSAHGNGVYIIWYYGNPTRVVYVGQGDIVDRLQSHRINSKIIEYAKQGILKVTWAELHETRRSGVERYLADMWKPLVGDTYPDVLPIPVNLPRWYAF